jgi:glycosyl transferase family 87
VTSRAGRLLFRVDRLLLFRVDRPLFRVGRLFFRVDRAAGGLAADLGLYALSAGFALVTALTSTLLPHRAWGAIAMWGYAAAALSTLAFLLLGRVHRAALTWLTWAAVALLPLLVEAVQRAAGRTDRAQEEVLVVERMGERLLAHGTPYLGPDAIRALPPADQLMGYSPYQPGMSVFGLPRAIAGDAWFTDARLWFALVTAGALSMATRLLGATPVRAVQAVTVLPICALTLATGGDDLPVLALCLLALVLAARDRFGWAGIAVGAAAAGKLFAFPVVAVLIAFACTRGRFRRLAPGAVGLPVLVLIPPLLVDADAFLENVIRFPLGHGIVTSPAQSPFPGYLIAQQLPGGRLVAAALLVTVAAAIGIRLIRRPPTNAAEAAMISGYGLLAAILLMPTTRFGYLLYPVAFLLWGAALSNHTAVAAPSDDSALYRR